MSFMLLQRLEANCVGLCGAACRGSAAAEKTAGDAARLELQANSSHL